jgi:hypothetical protein
MGSSAVRTAIGIALAGLTALGAGACTPMPQVLAPAPPDVRAQMSRVGILGPQPPLVTHEEPPTTGAGWGYLRGVGVCFRDMLEAAMGMGYGGGFAFFGAVAGCPTIGGVVGAVRTPSDAEVVEARTALERIGRESTLGDALRGDLAALLARDAPQYAVALLAPDDSEAPPLGAPVDTVVALGRLTVDLMQCDTHTHIVPPLTLYATVDVQLLRADTRAVLHQARLQYWGESLPFGVWGAAGAERFILGLSQAGRSLAEQIVQSFFVAETPTTLTWPRCGNQLWKTKGQW